MRLQQLVLGAALLAAATSAALAQNPPPGGRGGGRGGGGRGRGAIRVMTLASTAFADGGVIPARYAQPGEEVSPPLAWSGVPDSTQSFVLVVHDPDAAIGDGLDDVLHWMVWAIPGTATSLPEGVPQGPQLPDGMRQISVSGPYYRGPAAPASGPVHHYVFELYALDVPVNVPPTDNNAPVALRRAAVVAAMAGHVRGKAVTVGLFRRAP
ncbi:MAG TPA: YbhB/YbcL family Raf kinase inhibitor-like protein [Gemmatimonadaceae bacterium]|nr:YbhB/YbcL family Raf kinase inhibitor-like protein [Gemmatimonadaceae bacterium]